MPSNPKIKEEDMYCMFHNMGMTYLKGLGVGKGIGLIMGKQFIKVIIKFRGRKAEWMQLRKTGFLRSRYSK